MKLQIIPARSGLHWVGLGLRTYARSPMALGGLLLLGFTAVVGLPALLEAAGLSAWAGFAAMAMLWPAFALMTMVAAAEVWQGRKPRWNVLWVAFHNRQCARAMLLLGLLYGMALALVLGLSMLLDGGSFARLYLGLAPEVDIADMDELLALFADPQVRAAMWLYLGATLLLGLPLWHAPALIYWHRIAPLKALFFSTVACVRNMGAFALYTLAWFGLWMLAGALPVLVGSLLAAGPGGVSEPGMVLIALAILLLLLPLCCAFAVSWVFSFRDCFAAPEAQ